MSPFAIRKDGRYRSLVRASAAAAMAAVAMMIADQLVAELGAGLRIGRDAARVVVGSTRYETWAEFAKQRDRA